MARMARCPRCNAPSPAGETACWSCGASALAAPQGSVAPSAPAPAARNDYQSPCPKCRRPVAVYHPACKHCGLIMPSPGRPGTRPVVLPPGFTPPAPSGWNAGALPDGCTHLTRTVWGRLNDAAAPVVFGVMGVLFGLMTPGASGAEGPALMWLTLLFYAALGIGGLSLGVWYLFGRKEWRVGPDCLELSHQLGTFRTHHRYTSGTFLVDRQVRYSRTGRHPVWRLQVTAPEGKRVLAEAGRFSATAPQELGQYLAARTGWRLEIADNANDPTDWPHWRWI